MGTGLLQVVSTFTATPTANALRGSIVGAGIAEDIGFVLYSQMNEYMLRPDSDKSQVVGAIILLRLEDWLRDRLKSASPGTNADSTARRQLLSRTDDFVSQLAVFSQRSGQAWLLVCPSTGWIATRHKLGTLCRTHSNVLIARTRKLPVTILDCPSFLTNGSVNDHSADRLGHMPYLPEGFDQLGEYVGASIVRTLQQRNSAPTATTTTSSAELGAYLAALRVHVKLAAVEASDRAHVDRLLRTAAGFSLTGENPNIEDAEVDRLFESRTCFLISVADRYSDYGPMGFVFVRTIDDTLLVDSMALSCVVLGKQVEFAVLSGLAQYAAERNLHRIAFEYNSSGRNQSIYGFLQSVSDSESQTRFSVLVSAVESRLKVAAVSPGTWTVRFEPTAERRGVLS